MAAGPVWYAYPYANYPYYDLFTPPAVAPGYWYWCPDYQQYYPYLTACPSGWQAVPSQ